MSPAGGTPDRAHLDAVIGTCLHCGLCLPVCPTYGLTLDERSSPRGRIRLIRSVLDGSLRPGRAFADEMNFCLDCRACEPACPAGVRYGELVEHARALVHGEKLEPLGLRIKKALILRGVFRSARTFALFSFLMRIYRKSGLREAVERSGILSVMPAAVGRMISALPDVADAPFLRGGSTPAEMKTTAPVSGRAALLTGCIMNVSFPEVHRETAGLLLRAGFDVVIPGGQFCCGSLHAHNGDPGHARKLATELISAFPPEDGTIVVNSAGCGAFMKEYPVLLAGDSVMAARAEAFSKRVRDVSEFLAAAGVRAGDTPVACAVTYHEACHLVHAQGISKEPRSLIASVRAVRFVELPDATRCCGSAGIYNLVRPDDSDELLRAKVASIISTGARIVVTGNPGCHLQILRGLRGANSDVEVLHPVSLLRRTGESRRP